MRDLSCGVNDSFQVVCDVVPMSVRTSFIGIGVAGALVAGLVAGLARAHETAPPSLGDTIEVSSSPPAGNEAPRTAGGPDGGTGASPAPGSPSSPANTSDTAITGGRAVAPPPVAPDDDDDGPYGDDDDDDDDDD